MSFEEILQTLAGIREEIGGADYGLLTDFQKRIFVECIEAERLLYERKRFAMDVIHKYQREQIA